MRHFVCYPCADPIKGNTCALKWRSKGYEPLVMTYLEDWKAKASSDWLAQDSLMNKPHPFPGYYRVINTIANEAFSRGADLITCIGDDMSPPSQGAKHHSALYFSKFPDGIGVMQCTGDRQGQVIGGKVASERICGSPTFGKAWNNQAFLGHGAFGDYGFRSYYADEMLYEVAVSLDLMYQEKSLSIDHEHWSFGRSQREWWHIEAGDNWDRDQHIFMRLKEDGFPGSGLLV